LLTLAVVICNIDRMVINILLEPIGREFRLEDWQLGLLTGLGFTAFYVLGSFVFARQAERRDRISVLTLAIVAWSAMTVFCGLAASFLQLLFVRMGVGAAESGCQPVCHSLMGDLFTDQERPVATGIFAAGTLAGGLLALPLGGYIAEIYGWRTAMIAVGLPGFLIALGLHLFAREPRPQATEVAARTESLGAAIGAIVRNAALRNAILGAIFFTIASAASLSFGPLYLMRVFELSTGEAGVAYGLFSGVTAVLANLGIGYVASRLTRRSASWPPALAALGAFLEVPATLLFLLAPTLPLALAGLVLKSITGVMWFGPIIATVQMVAPPERRATSAACLVASYTLIGFGLGPVVAGAVGGILEARLGPAAIGGGMIALLPFALLACFHFYRATIAMRDFGTDRAALD
jgi:predicted MFS family arabinose efflux permease